MTFDPKKHITNLRGKEYLEVKWRIVWFKDEHPNGSIRTEVVSLEPVVMKATIANGQGEIIASGHGTATTAGNNAVWKGREIEKAETAAIGRALAHAGYGTQFTGEDEDENLADSTVQRNGKAAQPEPAQWATEDNLNTLVGMMTDTLGVELFTLSDLARLAGIDKADDLSAWNDKFATGKEAYEAALRAHAKNKSKAAAMPPRDKVEIAPTEQPALMEEAAAENPKAMSPQAARFKSA